ncbi:MAG: UTP--glucose-1-phosphate uridylyltransferase GalU [Thermodesulfobacteriota bacterium]
MKIRKAVFPVAGLGTRFLPATKAIPKEMLPLVDKPLIQYVIEEAQQSGLEEAIIVTGTGKTAIEDHFDASVELERFLREKGKRETAKMLQDISRLVHLSSTRQKRPKGLGDAILCSKGLVGREPFAVLLGDDIIDSKVPAIKQMIGVYNDYGASVLAVQKVPKSQAHLYGIIKARKVAPRIYEVLDLVEKPKKAPPSNLAIIGRYLLTPEIFESIEMTRPGRGGEIQITDAMKLLSRKQPIYGYEFEGERFDAGDKLGYLKANVAFALKRKDMRSDFRRFLKGLSL